jgi:hypothetical protein
MIITESTPSFIGAWRYKVAFSQIYIGIFTCHSLSEKYI